MAGYLNFGEIQDEIKDRLLDDGLAPFIIRSCNAIYGEIISMQRWWWLRRTDTFSTVVGQADYTLGSDLLDNSGSIARILLMRQTDTPLPLDYIDYIEWHRAEPDPTNSSTPRQWSVKGSNSSMEPIVTFRPIPDAVIPITMEFETTVSNMVNRADVPLIPEIFREALVAGPCRNIYMSKNKADLALICDQIFSRAIAGMTAQNEVQTEFRYARRPNNEEIDRVPHVNLGPNVDTDYLFNSGW